MALDSNGSGWGGVGTKAPLALIQGLFSGKTLWCEPQSWQTFWRVPFKTVLSPFFGLAQFCSLPQGSRPRSYSGAVLRLSIMSS